MLIKEFSGDAFVENSSFDRTKIIASDELTAYLWGV